MKNANNSKNAAVKSNKALKKGPGRPSKPVVWPSKKEWTFADMVAANDGICNVPTCRNHLNKDMYVKGGNSHHNSLVIRAKNEDGSFKLGKSNSESGKGRKTFIYTLRNPIAKKSKPVITVPVVDINPAPVAEVVPVVNAALEATVDVGTGIPATPELTPA